MTGFGWLRLHGVWRDGGKVLYSYANLRPYDSTFFFAYLQCLAYAS
jgi:hypothetical protein